jgi:hypothetical protein
MKSKVCRKHKDKPAVIYGECVGCEIEQLHSEIKALKADKLRLDWLADTNNQIGEVLLPKECVLSHVESMRDAIDAAMAISS